MKSSNVGHIPYTSRYTSILRKQELQALYTEGPMEKKQGVLKRLGPLQHAFTLFLAYQQQLQPMNNSELAELFDACSDPQRSADELVEVLHALAPGNGRIGFEQVNFLADHLRARVANFLSQRNYDFRELIAHDHVFGSGGDFCKTIHASTAAAILAAPRVPICKTGTTNVTSFHGSAQAMLEFGYGSRALSVASLNSELSHFGFAFVPLSALGFPYSESLKAARGRLWHAAKDLLVEQCGIGERGWQEAMRNTAIPLDIFKIVSPNAQVLHPTHHSTGVCHLSMIPYVLSLYLHLHSQGIIVYSYDGIDEFATASSNPDPNTYNNLIIWVRADDIVFLECSPEDIGFPRATLSEIQEEENLSVTNNDIWQIISGKEKGAKRDFLVANAALLLVAAQQTSPSSDLLDQLKEAVQIVENLIDSGRTGENFHRLLEAHNQRS